MSSIPCRPFFHSRIAAATIAIAAALLHAPPASQAAEGMVSDRTFATALYGQAVRLTGIEDYSKALSLLTRAVEVDPKFSDGLLLRGKLSQLMSSAEETIQQRTKEIAALPKGNTPAMAVARRERGVALYRVGCYKEAIADLNLALAQKPNEVALYYQRGLAFAALKDGPHALADYQTYRRLTTEIMQSQQARAAERQANLL